VAFGEDDHDNIYFLLRNELDARPRPSDIEAVVQFLSSPLLAAVSSPGKGKYVSDEHPSTIARKLRALALAAQQAADRSG
jgi:hypothetical protein